MACGRLEMILPGHVRGQWSEAERHFLEGGEDRAHGSFCADLARLRCIRLAD
jgi:hypothetical protein